jgi:hypothetical protein
MAVIRSRHAHNTTLHHSVAASLCATSALGHTDTVTALVIGSAGNLVPGGAFAAQGIWGAAHSTAALCTRCAEDAMACGTDAALAVVGARHAQVATLHQSLAANVGTTGARFHADTVAALVAASTDGLVAGRSFAAHDVL